MGHAEVHSRDSIHAARVIVAAALMVAISALLFVTYATAARAAGALAIGACGAYGQAYDYGDQAGATDDALAQCPAGKDGDKCKLVATLKRSCAALAVDGSNPCAAQGWAKGARLGGAQNAALKACYDRGGKDCVIRTFLCDAKG
ncbi:MAG: DUF4189 domain-containing protein [Pseudolabrys sp.]|nr:DUF4189 domain-containing protein [Pseudolabrys sp.]MBV9955771.1 DUF4189 domain-containing protein [Pseudolabrys sp.]